MEKKSGIIAIVISVIALGLATTSLVMGTVNQNSVGKDIQYALYLGTNDKDTYEPFGTPEEVKTKVDEVLSGYFEGFTIQEANGGWTSDEGVVLHEYTVVILLSDTTSEKVYEAANALVKEFNQSSILIQKNMTTTEFYSGE